MKDSWKFRRVILHCAVICGVFVGSNRLLTVLKRYLTFWSVLYCWKMFSWFLSVSKRLLYVLRHSMKFWGCCEESYGFCVLLKRFVNVLRGCLTFWCLPT